MVRQFLPGVRGYQPNGIVKKMRIGMLNTAVFLTGHRMPRQEPGRYTGAEDVFGSRHDFRLRRAYIGDQCVRRDQRANSLEQIDDAAHRRGENDKVAAAHRFFGIDSCFINCAEIARLQQHMLSIAPHNAPRESGPAGCKREGSPDQPRPDNRDLLEAHSTESSATISLFWMLRMMSIMRSKIWCRSVLVSGPWLAREILRSTSRSRSCSRIGMSVLRLIRPIAT